MGGRVASYRFPVSCSVYKVAFSSKIGPVPCAARHFRLQKFISVCKFICADGTVWFSSINSSVQTEQYGFRLQIHLCRRNSMVSVCKFICTHGTVWFPFANSFVRTEQVHFRLEKHKNGWRSITFVRKWVKIIILVFVTDCFSKGSRPWEGRGGYLA